MKSKRRSALWTVECLSLIYGITHVYDNIEAGRQTNWVEWAKNEISDNEDVAYMAYDELDFIEPYFALAAFFHSRNVCHGEKECHIIQSNDHAYLLEVVKENYKLCNRLMINTCENCSSVISVGQ